jgi:hypothetical protein
VRCDGRGMLSSPARRNSAGVSLPGSLSAARSETRAPIPPQHTAAATSDESSAVQVHFDSRPWSECFFTSSISGCRRGERGQVPKTEAARRVLDIFGASPCSLPFARSSHRRVNVAERGVYQVCWLEKNPRARDCSLQLPQRLARVAPFVTCLRATGSFRRAAC